MKYLITGGTGLIGSHLITGLLKDGHEVHNLSREARPSHHEHLQHHAWNGREIPPEIGSVDVVVNLAGANVGKRWTEAYKKMILSSRVDATRACTSYIQSLDQKPEVFISASGYNYYGSLFSATLDESAPAGDGFMARVCQEWEAAAQGAGIRTVILRTSVVLDKEEGPLSKLITPYKLFVGGPTGTGRQGFPWIHVTDMVWAIRFIVANHGLSGPVNMVVPRHGNMNDFSRELAAVLRRPHFFRLPKGLLELIFGEMSIILWGGGFIEPKKLEERGFSWTFPDLREALEDLLKS